MPGAEGPSSTPSRSPEYRARRSGAPHGSRAPQRSGPPRLSGAPRRGRETVREGAMLLPLAAFTLIIVAKLWVTRWITLGDANPLWALVVEGGFFLLLLALVGIIFPKWRVWAWLAVDILASVLCIVVLVYVEQYNDVPTLAAAGVAGELGAVGDSVVSLLHVWYAWFFLDVVAIAAVFASPLRRVLAVRKRPDARLLAVLGAAVVWVTVSIVVAATAAPLDSGTVGAQRMGLVAYGLFAKSSAGLSDDQVDAAIAAEAPVDATGTASAAATGGVPATGSVPVRPIGKVDYKEPASVQVRFDYLQGYASSGRVAGAPAAGAFKGKNVIVVQVESLASWTVGAHVNGHPVTPNVDALIKQSWYAPHTVTQIGEGNTSDAEFTAMTSLVARGTSPASYTWGDKVVPSLPRLVRAKGYVALTFHPNDITFWHRNALYPALGYTRWYSRPDFPTNDIVGIGASDKTIFAKALDVLESKASSGQPFLGDIVTLSSHSPYTAGSARSDLAIPADLQGTQTGRYLRALHYADSAIGAFVARLKRDGLWDDSVLVMYGDHFGVRPWGYTPYAVTAAEKREFPKVLGRQPEMQDVYSIPLIVHVPGQTIGSEIDSTRAQVDIMPTVADLLGLSLAQTPHIGASLFDDRPRFAAIRYHTADGTFVSDSYYYQPGASFEDGRVIELADSKTLPVSTVPKSLFEGIQTLMGLDGAYLDSLPNR